MIAEVAMDMRKSSGLFESHVWPILREWIGGEMMLVENEANVGMRDALDCYAGIDAFHVIGRDGRMRGIASRVQCEGYSWDTFTIRMSRDSGARTELAKRLYALEHQDEGWLFPALTTQAYFKGDKLLSMAAMYTADLLAMYQRGMWLPRQVSNATFAAISWGDVKRFGKYPIEIYKESVNV